MCMKATQSRMLGCMPNFLAGCHIEYKQKVVQENRVYVIWGGLDVILVKLKRFTT